MRLQSKLKWKSAMAQVSLIAKLTSRTETKVGHGNLMIPGERITAESI